MVKLARAEGAPFFRDDETVPGLLARAAAERPDHVYMRANGEEITCASLAARVEHVAAGFAALGVKPGDRVAVMMGHHLDHVICFFAIMRAGAVLVPVNVAIKGPGLVYQIEHSAPSLIVADAEFSDVLAEPIRAAQAKGARADVVWRLREGETVLPAPGHALSQMSVADAAAAPVIAHDWKDLRIILYTSGTTGAPKGVQMSDRMVQATALGSIWLSDMQPGSVLHFWDPIYHVFGAEVLVLALMVPVTLHMVPRFSASKFWSEVKDAGATHIHFVGGVLQLLLKQPPNELDLTHGARIAWGGGCPRDVWGAFEERFGIEIREGYGMTETSSFSTINPGGSKAGKLGSIGTGVDYYAVEVVDELGNPCAPGVPGEIRVAEREPGVLTVGYYENAEATASALREGWLYTGDLAHVDADGFITYLGRKKDSLRRRGENISAWEVERVVNDHPEVAECALVGVVNEMGDEDLKIFVRRIEGSTLQGADLLAWSAERMARFQVPRFVRFIEEFRKTPTQRIQKQFLSNSIEDFDYDAESRGARAER
ncbi:ATP-dependent acyl-CoA ligase [Pseudorhizobium endolithicum]|uniref:ATP-dependent acyl-CoA ligase n=1 Tax=Pseudorhizobium endolithicum TaxID=1191678 RepID=A0ABN7JLY8_9HYPH|nr:AMP-binding protein [Pseudorhizobium endolithicum]CAD7037655.1 ATP-dependent acyl-CoA ligase [Pseudorhizobium endolithicum]